MTIGLNIIVDPRYPIPEINSRSSTIPNPGISLPITLTITVLRFNDEDMLEDIENVERVLVGFIEEFEKLHPLTPASLPTGVELKEGGGHSVPIHKK